MVMSDANAYSSSSMRMAGLFSAARILRDDRARSVDFPPLDYFRPPQVEPLVEFKSHFTAVLVLCWCFHFFRYRPDIFFLELLTSRGSSIASSSAMLTLAKLMISSSGGI